MNRRSLILGAAGLLATAGPAFAFGGRFLVDFDTPGCEKVAGYNCVSNS